MRIKKMELMREMNHGRNESRTEWENTGDAGTWGENELRPQWKI